MAHLLVTGGAGYVGSHTLKALRQAGHSTVVFDDMRAGHEQLTLGAPLVRGDVCDREAVARLLERRGPFDGVLHFAALLSVPESVAHPLRYYHNNVTGSATLLREALDRGVGSFVLSSTAAVYGNPQRQPTPEDTALAPINPYGASKLMVERMLADLEQSDGLHWAALRYFNAAGADPEGELGECHDPESHLIPVALEASAGLREELQLFGSDYPTPDGTCVRDYIHVSDLATAHVLAIEALLEGRQIGARNLGTGRGHSNRQVLAAVERVVGRPVPCKEAARRPGDPAELVADASRFQTELGWKPAHSDLDEIVATAWAWLRRWKQL